MQASTSKATHTFPLGSHITSLRFAPKSDVLAVSASKLTGNVWSGSFFILGDKGQIIQRVELDHGCSAVAWSLKKSDALFVATDDGLIRLWSISDRAEMLQLYDGHNDVISSLAVEPTAPQRLATAAYDRTIKIWNTEVRADLPELVFDNHLDCVTAVSWNPQTAGVLASGGWDALLLWDIRSKERKCTQFNASSKVLTLSWASEFTLYYGTEYGAIATLDVRKLSAPTATSQVQADMPVRALGVNPADTEQFAAGGDNTSVAVYSKSLERLYGYDGHSDFVATVDWSRTQTGLLASGGFDRTVHWWRN